jgi:hypothetical protein
MNMSDAAEHKNSGIKGSYVEKHGERFYKIENYHLMPPFFINLVSRSDLWMFIYSNGALTAGRKDPDHALFPYYNDDLIADSADITGSKTMIRAVNNGISHYWEPFSDRCSEKYAINRNIYKNVYGNKIIFEEINNDLELSFEYGWCAADAYGFVRSCLIQNRGAADTEVTLLDGVQNILPAGVPRVMQLELSTLTNAYKKNELLSGSGIGIYYLSSIPTDKAEPSEGLRAAAVWSVGFDNPVILLCSDQCDAFRKGAPVTGETDVRARRGAYLLHASLTLAAGGIHRWYLAADVDRESADITALQEELADRSGMAGRLEKEIRTCTDNLAGIVAAADGLQRTADELTTARYFSNVLFNIMRGGVFNDNYRVAKKDLLAHISSMNSTLAAAAGEILGTLPDVCEYARALAAVRGNGGPSLQRICYEYLPLTWSRRHGDPSRPWNLFSIQTQNPDGGRRLYYQGNWRDIFQNWEALCVSFPEFTESMICRFVNASTDGNNPYRFTSDGIDWETSDPRNPWSNIGYWGDHQLIYLLKLLEISHRYHPRMLKDFLSRDIFSYANVPYRIKSYEELLSDPHNTVIFDGDLDREIKKRAEQLGGDAKLLSDEDGHVYHVNLAEKLLLSVLTKLSNFIPEAGIWLNTQRPEWNDANNALVGYGVSVVTLCYLRRFLEFCAGLFAEERADATPISAEVAGFLGAVNRSLQTNKEMLSGRISDEDRRRILDMLGEAGSAYRRQVYKHGLAGRRTPVSSAHLHDFFSLAMEFVDHSIKANKRPDNLYHSYNLMEPAGDGRIAVHALYEMLEGQVAVLSSGLLSPREAVDLLDALRQSSLYRGDQYSYLLYPDRQLPRFMQKNNIPADMVEKSRLLSRLVKDGDTGIILRDVKGGYHFNADFRNANDLTRALKRLGSTEYADAAARDTPLVLAIFEKVFNHRSFTGRSGTFYGYEGLGCIYWHMVSKLVLAVQENYFWAVGRGADPQILGRLVEHYYAVRAGIGFNKTPGLYGAFPTDPYSHTPGNGGAKQPGMTGQVKEDILCRWGELGLIVADGRITINPRLLRRAEFVDAETEFSYVDIQHSPRKVRLEKDSLGFTYCQVPVLYHLSSSERIRITLADGSERLVEGLDLDRNISSSIFSRDGRVSRLDVYVTPALA